MEPQVRLDGGAGGGKPYEGLMCTTGEQKKMWILCEVAQADGFRPSDVEFSLRTGRGQKKHEEKKRM